MFPPPVAPGIAGACHLVFFGVYLPFACIRGWWKHVAKQQPFPDRRQHFRNTVLVLATCLCVSLAVARVQHIDIFAFDAGHLVRGMLGGAAMYAAAVAYMRPRWRRAVERRARVVDLFMPENRSERAWWIAVSVVAGVGEEITWRGVQTALLYGLTGSLWIAGLGSAVAFALAHAIQGWRSVGVIALFALSFQTVAWLSGSLFVAMIVHVAYDVTAGLSYGKLGRELGYKREDAAVEASGAGTTRS
jgi:membrane protease YdiL (CAAX protease family)